MFQSGVSSNVATLIDLPYSHAWSFEAAPPRRTRKSLSSLSNRNAKRSGSNSFKQLQILHVSKLWHRAFISLSSWESPFEKSCDISMPSLGNADPWHQFQLLQLAMPGIHLKKWKKVLRKGNRATIWIPSFDSIGLSMLRIVILW